MLTRRITIVISAVELVARVHASESARSRMTAACDDPEQVDVSNWAGRLTETAFAAIARVLIEESRERVSLRRAPWLIPNVPFAFSFTRRPCWCCPVAFPPLIPSAASRLHSARLHSLTAHAFTKRWLGDKPKRTIQWPHGRLSLSFSLPTAPGEIRPYVVDGFFPGAILSIFQCSVNSLVKLSLHPFASFHLEYSYQLERQRQAAMVPSRRACFFGGLFSHLSPCSVLKAAVGSPRKANTGKQIQLNIIQFNCNASQIG